MVNTLNQEKKSRETKPPLKERRIENQKNKTNQIRQQMRQLHRRCKRENFEETISEDIIEKEKRPEKSTDRGGRIYVKHCCKLQHN